MTCGGLAWALGATSSAQADAPSYNRHVLPILSSKCFPCHGVDRAKRKARLRLDRVEEAYAERKGGRAIVPSRPDESLLVERIFATDPDEVMPPPDEGLDLTAEEKTVLRRWVGAGAKYEAHWAFVAPKKPDVPAKDDWGRNEIDAFVLERLRANGLQPQNAERRERLFRRVTLDLTGLPPTIEELDRYLADKSASAYERVVDRLLDSPRFGERMAAWWLDGARYGDSHGYDNDLHNSQWPWRNWVIESFNENKPFDEFTTEQLAGDLLPNATNAQVLATAIHRNHRIQTEGGAIDEEWRTEYVIDRVETVGAVWMGLTLSCARCHDHKYDPISQKEFYQLFALFNNLDEKGFINNLSGSAEPRIRYREKEYQESRASIEARVKDKKQREREIRELDARHPSVMIMRDMPKPRKAFILVRGQYDAPSDEVRPGLPAALSPPKSAEPTTRRTLAAWLVSGAHPLTARVFVNRIWEQIFGLGIVESSENFGVQADWPSHPELLDWLAVRFVESDWDIKQLIRSIVTSETYRQSSVVDAARQERDPTNKWLSRGPRVRLAAELVRDQALAISGLLVEKIGGLSVKPYQPAGLWEEIEKRGKFHQDHGEKLYRRSLYTTIRRTVAPPDMVLFDMPSREVCTVRRSRTNTPLQALALMNSVTYVEAAKKFAERMIVEAPGKTARERIAWGFRCATARQPTDRELGVLHAGYERRRVRYRENAAEAKALLGSGESKVSEKLDAVELAALTTVANVILNLDELINR